jgi:hypothetical protein
MSAHDVLEVQQGILEALNRQRKDYLTLPQLVKAAGAPLLLTVGAPAPA